MYITVTSFQSKSCNWLGRKSL